MQMKRLLMVASMLFLCSSANAIQTLDVPDRPTFDDRLPQKKKRASKDEVTFEATGVIKREKSNLIICSEGAASGENLKDALDACDAAVAEEPQNGDACYYRGFVFYYLERYADAEQDFTTVIDLGANRVAESYYQRGACKEQQHKLREASADFKRAHELKPDWATARRKVEEYEWAYQ